MFRFSFNFESSVKISFQQNSRVKFSFICLTWYNFSCRLSFNFTFISWETCCLFEILIGCSRSKKRNLSVGYCFLPLWFGPRIRTFVWFWFYFFGKIFACLKYISAIEEASDECILRRLLVFSLLLTDSSFTRSSSCIFQLPASADQLQLHQLLFLRNQATSTNGRPAPALPSSGHLHHFTLRANTVRTNTTDRGYINSSPVNQRTA